MIALGADGDVYSWGYGLDGACGHGNTYHLRLPKRLVALQGFGVSYVAAGSWYLLYPS